MIARHIHCSHDMPCNIVNRSTLEFRIKNILFLIKIKNIKYLSSLDNFQLFLDDEADPDRSRRSNSKQFVKYSINRLD